MQRLRIYHLFLAMLVLAAYFTGDDDRVHAWLGYGVAAVIAVRMLMALAGAPQLGLMRFYPQFEGLKLGTALTHPAISRSLLLGIAVCTIGAVGTGIWMDRGHTFGMGGPAEEACGRRQLKFYQPLGGTTTRKASGAARRGTTMKVRRRWRKFTSCWPTCSWPLSRLT